jgi:hypothetical protein
MATDRPAATGLPPPPTGCSPTRWVSRPHPAAAKSPAWWLAVLCLGVAIPWLKAGTPLIWGTIPTLAVLALIPLAAQRTELWSGDDWMASAGWRRNDVVTLSRIDRIRGGAGRTGVFYVVHDDRGGKLTAWLHELTPEMREQLAAAVRAAHARGVRTPSVVRRVAGVPDSAGARWIRAWRRNAHRPGTPPAHLSMSPTTKNIEPRMATRSGISVPGSRTCNAWMLLNEADRSFSRHGVFSPRETR